MNIKCLFPECEKQLQQHDLEDHIRHHFHLKLHSCFCGKRFYALTDLQEHLETSADDETHCSTEVCPGDVYLKALVSRVVADFRSAENGASILEIASNLRQRAHSVASRSTSVTPARTVVEKRPLLELQKEVVPQKVHCSSQMEDSSEDLTILVPSRSATKSPIRPVEKSSERERNFSESLKGKEDHKLSIREQSSASTNRTAHEANADVISEPMLPIEKMTLGPELSKLGDDACQKLPLVSTVEFGERRAHVANTHVTSNEGDWGYTGYYRQELAYHAPRRFSSYSTLSRPTDRRSFSSLSYGTLRNSFGTVQMWGRGRQHQSRPNRNWHRRGSRL